MNDEQDKRKLIFLNKPRMKFVKEVFNQVLNMGYSRHGVITKFQCVSSWCKYKIHDANEFFCHLQKDHSEDSSIGSHNLCVMCESKLKIKNLEEEFNHMMSHFKSKADNKQLSGLSNTQNEEKSNSKAGCDLAIELPPSPETSSDEINHIQKNPIDLKLDLMFGNSSENTKILNATALPRLSIEPSATTSTSSPNKDSQLPSLQISLSINIDKTVKEKLTTPTKQSNYSNNKVGQSSRKEEKIVNNLNHNKKIVPITRNYSKPSRRKSSKDSNQRKRQKSRQDELICNNVKPQTFRSDLKRKLAQEVSVKIPLSNHKNKPKTVGFIQEDFEARKASSFPSTSKSSNQAPKSSPIPMKKQKFSESDSKISKTHHNSSSNKSNVDHELNFRSNEENTPPKLKSIEKKISSSPRTSRETSSANLRSLNVNEMMPYFESFIVHIQPSMEESFYNVSFKYQICFDKMLSKQCLISLFKCMGKNCSFFCNNPEIFLNHLIHHRRRSLLPANSYYMYCSYCNMKSSDTKEIIHHINDVHGRDVHQCSLCFFRSRESQICYQHILKYHKNEYKNRLVKIYKCPAPPTSSKEEENYQKRILKKKEENIQPFTCQNCNLSFFIVDEYLKHLEQYETSEETSERKILDGSIKVLDLAFETKVSGKFQCIFCHYGTVEKDEMHAHMEAHPSEKFLYCVRMRAPGSTAMDITSVETINVNTKVDIEIISIEENRTDEVIKDFKITVDSDLEEALNSKKNLKLA